jgi:hypothetical protein
MCGKEEDDIRRGGGDERKRGGKERTRGSRTRTNSLSFFPFSSHLTLKKKVVMTRFYPALTQSLMQWLRPCGSCLLFSLSSFSSFPSAIRKHKREE